MIYHPGDFSVMLVSMEGLGATTALMAPNR